MGGQLQMTQKFIFQRVKDGTEECLKDKLQYKLVNLNNERNVKNQKIIEI